MEPRAVIKSKTFKRKGKEVNYLIFHLDSTFRCKCEMERLLDFLEHLNRDFKIYYEIEENEVKLYGDVERLVKKLVIFCSACQCARNRRTLRRARELIPDLSYFEDMFWYTKIIENFEKGGYWKVCRVITSFRKLYGLDK